MTDEHSLSPIDIEHRLTLCEARLDAAERALELTRSELLRNFAIVGLALTVAGLLVKFVAM